MSPANHFLFFLLLTLCIFSSAKAQEARLIIAATNSEEQQIRVGTPFLANLILVPATNNEIASFRALEGKKIADDHLYLSTLIDKKRSSENIDALDVTATLVLLKVFSPDGQISLKLNQKTYPIFFRNFRIVDSETIPKDYIIQDQAFSQNIFTKNKLLLYFVVGLPIILIFARWQYHLAIKRHKRREHEMLVELWRKRFFEAQSRQDFELLAQEKKQWLPLLLSPEHAGAFLNTIEQHQYKRNWSELEEREVSNAFAVIKNLQRTDYHGI